MKLEKLNPSLLEYSLRGTSHTFENIGGRGFDLGVLQTIPEVRTITEVSEAHFANGISFDCPNCSGELAHRVTCWFQSVPVFADPSRYRWNASGSLRTLNMSIAFENELIIDSDEDCRWRGEIKNGEIICQPK